METQSKISTWQFFSLLLVSRLLTALTFMPVSDYGGETTDYIIGSLIGCVLIPIVCLPLYFIYRQPCVGNVVEEAYGSSKVLSKTLCVLYALLFCFSAFSTLMRMSFFSAAVVFPQTDTKFFIFLTVAAVCYGASLGLEPIGRAGSIALALLIASFTLIFITLISKINTLNLTPAFYGGFAPNAKTAWAALSQTTEPAVMAVMLGRVRGNVKKGFWLWAASLPVCVGLLFFFMMSVLGKCALLQLFPVHALAVLSKFGMLERLDVLLTGVWIASAFIKTTFMIYLTGEMLSQAFSRLDRRIVIAVEGVLLVAGVSLASASLSSAALFCGDVVNTVVFGLFIIVIPCLVIVVGKFRKRREK